MNFKFKTARQRCKNLMKNKKYVFLSFRLICRVEMNRIARKKKQIEQHLIKKKV